MKPNLSEWASIVEIISGIAVVVSLLLLFVGIRENTEIVRASTYFEIIDGFQEVDRDMWRDPELSLLFTRWLTGNVNDLDEAQRAQLRQFIVISLRNYEKAYFAEQYGILGEREWLRMRAGICNLSVRASEFGLDAEALPILTEDFRSFIGDCDSLIE
jgi:hypothetical protein